MKKRKRGIIIGVGGSGLNPGCVMPEFTIWSNEVNLDITDTILVSHAQLGKSPIESQELLRDAFLKGKDFKPAWLLIGGLLGGGLGKAIGLLTEYHLIHVRYNGNTNRSFGH